MTQFKVLVGDNTTPQARVPKKAEQTYLAPVTLTDIVLDAAFELEVTVEQSGTSGYTGRLVNVVETSVGTGPKLLEDWQLGGVSKASIDRDGKAAFAGGVSLSGGTDALSAYAEGAWTPTVQDASYSDSEGQTYSIQEGHYTKIGNVVFVTCRLRLTSFGTLTTAEPATIAGLPFTSNAGADTNATINFGSASSLNLSAAGYSLAGTVTPGTTRIGLAAWDSIAGLTTATLDELSANAILTFSGFYRV